MEDYFDLPNINSNVSVFYAAGATTWQVWNKPKNSRFIMISCIGGAGGGGGGQSGAGTDRRGGGGGGPSPHIKGIFPSIFVPDILYVNVGIGGSGGTANNSGGTGSISYVSASPSTDNFSILMQSSSTAPSGGQSIGTGGSSGNPNVSTLILGQLSVFEFPGLVRNGAAGGASSGGAGTNAQIDYALCPGAGGGGASSTGVCGSGGNVLTLQTNTQYPIISGGTASGTTKGGDGTKIMMPNNSGYITALASLYGGAGGGGNGTAAGTNIGGDGGNGYYGCGGGGGGAGDTGGNGGKGGDGFVMIISY